MYVCMCVLKALNRCSPHQWTMFLLEDMNYENISAWYELFSPKHPKSKRSLSLLLDAHHNPLVKPYCWRHHTLVAGHRKLDLELTKNLFVYWIVFLVIRSPMQCPGRENASIVSPSTGARMPQYQPHRQDVPLTQNRQGQWWGNQPLSWLDLSPALHEGIHACPISTAQTQGHRVIEKNIFMLVFKMVILSYYIYSLHIHIYIQRR